MPRARFASRPSTGARPTTSANPNLPDDSDWRDQGWCRDPRVDPDLFWPDDIRKKNVKAAMIREATEICFSCPVRQLCLESAIKTDEPKGIWGGKTRMQRVAIAKRGVAKPEKPEVRKVSPEQILAAGRQRCARCEVMKSLTEYARDSRMAAGYRTTCTACRTALDRQRRELRRTGAAVPMAVYPQTLRRRRRLLANVA